jgi:hypothetical protein
VTYSISFVSQHEAMHKAAPEAVSTITHNTMNRLSLADLKAQSNNVVANLEAIKGGNTAECHNGACALPACPNPNVQTTSQPSCGPCDKYAHGTETNGVSHLICTFLTVLHWFTN